MMQAGTPMTLVIAQQRVDDWIRTVGVRYFSELTNLGILQEECGELARLVVRIYGEQSFKKGSAPVSEADAKAALADEMADVLWVLLALANQTGVDLQAALERNFEKKSTRDSKRHRFNDKLQ
jgi:NTP pyrophosphatase (non-canonical NTP hydrolase)